MTKEELDSLYNELIKNNKPNKNTPKERRDEICELIKVEYLKHFSEKSIHRLCKCRSKCHNMILKLQRYVK